MPCDDQSCAPFPLSWRRLRIGNLESIVLRIVERVSGGEVKVTTNVEVFSMPKFFDSRAVFVCRAVAMFVFALMLARYIGEIVVLTGAMVRVGDGDVVSSCRVVGAEYRIYEE